MTEADDLASGMQVHNCTCQLCGREWIAVHPPEALTLECPSCHHMTGFIDFITPIQASNDEL